MYDGVGVDGDAVTGYAVATRAGGPIANGSAWTARPSRLSSISTTPAAARGATRVASTTGPAAIDATGDDPHPIPTQVQPCGAAESPPVSDAAVDPDIM
jgi:hypothetical protein